jgi:eukaryotic-like serine/threonine-protein kinase
MTSSAPGADPPSQPRSRVMLRKYRLDTKLGEGGSGSVWRAFNLQLEAPVAIKLLRAELDEARWRERLRLEAGAAAKLVHPHIVRIFDVDESEEGEPFIVMELLDGESLRTVIDRGALPAASSLQLLLPVAEALSLAHSRGVVHRDFRPDNVFLSHVGESLEPKLLDFGIAKVASTAAASGPSSTSSGVLWGNPEYMSPEQVLGRSDVDHLSDVWSFCVVLYEAMSGQSPFEAESTQETLRSVVHDDPIPLELLSDVEPALAALIARGLAKNRAERPQSIFDLGQELARWLIEQGVLEDATGARLDYKWLGCSGRGSISTGPRRSCEPLAYHEQATFVSVVRPGPLPAPPAERGAARGRAGLLAAGLAAAALLGWAGAHDFGPPPAAAAAAPKPATVAAARLSTPPPFTVMKAPPALAARAVEAEPNRAEPEPIATRTAPLEAADSPTDTVALRVAPSVALARTLPAALAPLDEPELGGEARLEVY